MHHKRTTAVAALLALLAGPGFAETYTANSWTGPSHAFTVNYEAFIDSVASASDGDISFELYTGGSLLPVKTALDGTGDRVADMANVIGTYIPADLPLNNVVNEASFLVNDHMPAAFAMTEINLTNPALQAEWDSHNVVFGAGWSNPSYYFACTKPIRSLADMSGKRIRTSGGAQVEWVNSASGNPITVPFSDVYSGLERGSIDCVMLGASDLGAGFQIWDVATSVTMLPMGTSITGAQYIFNKDMWRDLGDEDRRLLMDELALASARLQIDYDKRIEDSFAGSWERGLERIEPDQSLTDGLAAFRESFTAAVPQISEEKRGVPAAEAKALFDEYLTLYEKWDSLLAGVDRTDEAALAALLKSEVYDKLDAAGYGM